VKIGSSMPGSEIAAVLIDPSGPENEAADKELRVAPNQQERARHPSGRST
jgi:hypothetical protein